MSNPNEIGVGDRVSIEWVNTNVFIQGEVLGVPQMFSDSWKIKSDCGRIYYLNNFDIMLLVEKKGGE